MSSSDLCPDCKMPEGRHTSDCPVRLAAKTKPLQGDAALVKDLASWNSDPDVKLIFIATMKRHGVTSLADLPAEVIRDLHEAVALMMEESPTNTTFGDPRRMV